MVTEPSWAYVVPSLAAMVVGVVVVVGELGSEGGAVVWALRG